MLPGLVRSSARRARAQGVPEAFRPAEVDPVAQVLVDVPLAHLDRPFDYAVPDSMARDAVPGARVSVRFAGQVAGGFVVARTATSERLASLRPLRRVVSAEPVLSAAVTTLVGKVAGRYAGSRADVIRLAVPPRHAGTERAPSPPAPSPPSWDRDAALRGWRDHRAGAAFLDHLAAGRTPRAVWGAAPGTDWQELLARAAAATYAAGRGVLLMVPGARDLDRLDAALASVLGPDHHVVLRADAGPAARYAAFLAVSRGARRVVAGTRAAAFAPVRDLGLVAIWDDGDDLHAEPRAPYPHAREVLLLRAELEQTAALVGGFARSVEAEHLVQRGWAREISPPRAVLRERVTVSLAGTSGPEQARDPWATAARIPRAAWDAIRAGLREGPVLVQTARRGYAPSLLCDRCRAVARCRDCTGPLRQSDATAPLSCTWCGRPSPEWTCPGCGHRGVRAPVMGEARTAEELGRSLPGVRVRSSGGDRVLAEVPGEPAVVVATPGAEPVTPDGYPAVVLLDTWLALDRADLRVAEEALRRWLGAAALVRPGGRVVAVGDPAVPALQALVRWDPAGFAAREAQERRAARLPPASRLATITGDPGAVDDALTVLAPPGGTEVLGPAPTARPGEVRVVLRTPRSRGEELSAALGELQRVRSARKLEPVRVQVDPVTLA